MRARGWSAMRAKARCYEWSTIDLLSLTSSTGIMKLWELRRLPKLQRLTCDYFYHGRNPLVLGFVPQLSKLSLINNVTSNVTPRLSQLLANASSICELHLDFQSEKVLYNHLPQSFTMLRLYMLPLVAY
jgi:hypothetical protein